MSVWEAEFAFDRSTVTLISMISLIVYGVFQPITGKCNDVFGSRSVLTASMLLIGGSLIATSFADSFWELVLCYGVLASIGFSGGSNVTASAIANRWFRKRRGLATGIALTGMALGQMLLVPLTLYLIDMYDWRQAMLWIGSAVAIVFAPLCWLFVRDDAESREKEPIAAETPAPSALPIRGMLKERYFWMLSLPYFVCGFTDVGLISTHLIPFTEERGFSAFVIGLAFGVIGIANIAGTVVTGQMSDRMHRGKMLAVIYFIRAVLFVLLLQASTPVELFLFALLYGASEMASIAPTSTLSAHLFKRYGAGTVFGVVSVSHQFGAAAGSFFPGLLYDITGTYVSSFILSVGALMVSALLVWRLPDTERGKVNVKVPYGGTRR